MLDYYNEKPSYNPKARITSDTLPFIDEVLPSLLSPEGVIQIGDNIIKIDMNNKLAFVLKSSEESEINALYHSDTTNENIMVFSTYDEVLTLLEEGSKGTNPNNAKLALFGCGEKGAKGNARTDAPDYYVNGTRYRVDAKIAYQPSGIYFSLMSEAKHQYKTGSGFWERSYTNMDIYYRYQYKQKCKGWSPWTSKYVALNLNGNPSGPAWAEKMTHRYYSDTRSLSKYFLEVQFWYVKLSDYKWYTINFLYNPSTGTGNHINYEILP